MIPTTFPLIFPIGFDDAFDDGCDQTESSSMMPYYSNPDVNMASTSFPLIFPIIFDDAFDYAYNRMKNRLTTPYYTGPDGNIDKLMQMQALQIEKALHTIVDVEDAHKLAKATGYSLDQWGVLIGNTTREMGEDDCDYRARLFAQMAIYRRSATPQDMVSTCAGVLGVAIDRVTFVDEDSPASFGLGIFLIDIENIGIPLLNFSIILEAAKAGGTDMTIFTLGTYMPRSRIAADPNDNTKAPTSRIIPDPTCGTLSSRYT
jgi:hypothetical protein